MTAVDYILDGLEAALELERELGTRVIEIDRSLLNTAPRPAVVPPPAPVSASSRPTPVAPPRPARVTTAESATRDFVFLHEKALSAGGVEMMAKIITAMGKTPESAPIVFTGGLPTARYYVVLGREALRKWFPGKSAAPGQWLSDGEGRTLLVTYSPEYILRFGAVTPAVKKIKTDMWTSLKTVMQRTATRDKR